MLAIGAQCERITLRTRMHPFFLLRLIRSRPEISTPFIRRRFRATNSRAALFFSGMYVSSRANPRSLAGANGMRQANERPAAPTAAIADLRSQWALCRQQAPRDELTRTYFADAAFAWASSFSRPTMASVTVSSFPIKSPASNAAFKS